MVADHYSCMLVLFFCKHSYLLMRRKVNTTPPDAENAMAAEGAKTPGGVYLENKQKRQVIMQINEILQFSLQKTMFDMYQKRVPHLFFKS